MTRVAIGAAVFLVWLGVCAAGAAAQTTQTTPASADQSVAEDATGSTRSSGFAASVRFAVSDSRQGAFIQFVPRIGYDFNRWGVAFGVPLEYIGTSTTTQGATSHGGVGDVYLSLSYAIASDRINFFSTGSVTAPTGDSTIGLGAGESTWDWNNYVGHSFSRVTPFLDIGVGTSVGAGTNTTRVTGGAGRSRTFATPYTTVGTLAHGDVGMDIYLWGPLTLSASAYDTVPWGDQTVISLFVPPTGPSGQVLGPRRRRSFEVQAVTEGSSSLTADHGFSASLDLVPVRSLYLSVGFSRSVQMNLNVWTVSVWANLVRLPKKGR
ncbi:MAG: hypothetical protein A3G76_15630 [Acidobacteria bacterium RIFCSPLOWO2_12_FULL_65_11]|nr:MAG: hypothetical protein A3H95_17395 [Acidobacteria bacterium RIFCSPLOWO2_02_FULL_64_15]OFW30696.1 MAG: hypothetical protein A3G76_15630 [Acidobacteria bacterium RIFCSPLOWO2_12_FULL_65_11]